MTVFVYLMENREIQFLQSETFFLHVPLGKVFTEAAILLVAAA